MNIALLTDLHIAKEDEDTYQVDVRQNFLSVLSAIQEDQPDRMVIAGDLCCYDGHAEIYRWIKQQLDEVNIPYDLLIGNHDDSEAMVEVFGLESDYKNNCLYYTKAYEHWKAIFLDTGTKEVSKEQLDWLERQLHQSDSPILIFMHHPPIHSNVPFMDENHSLTNMDAIQNILMNDKRSFPIFSGHYHVEKTICKSNMILQITPACYFQIDESTSYFQVDHYKIAYRRIELSKDSWKSTVRYLEGNKLV